MKVFRTEVRQTGLAGSHASGNASGMFESIASGNASEMNSGMVSGMNGISVMACAWNEQAGMQNRYGICREGGRNGGRMYAQQKVIRIARHADHGSSRQACSGEHVAGADQTAVRPERSRQRVRKAPAQVRRGRRAHAMLFRMVVFTVVFTAMLAGFQIMTGATSREKEKTYKYYTTVTLGYGEDITDIVYRYCDSSEYHTPEEYVREICRINSIPWHKGEVPDLRAGTQIVIPYFDTELK